jgi:hypothetical protein
MLLHLGVSDICSADDDEQDGEMDSLRSGGSKNMCSAGIMTGSVVEAAAAADPTITSGWSGLLFWLLLLIRFWIARLGEVMVGWL